MGTKPDASLRGLTQSGSPASSDAPRRGQTLVLGDLVLVGVGGAAGALARYALTESLPVSSQAVTFGVNIAGAFLLGALVTFWAARHPRLLLILGTGLLGGFTTYSLFALQLAELGLAGQFGLATLYGLGTVVIGFAVTLVGAGCGGYARRFLVGRR